jgi:hypothetical protein
VHSTTEFSLFEIVYGFNSLTPMDLIPLSIDEMVCLDGNRKAQVVKTLHESMQQQITCCLSARRLGLGAYAQGEISGP